MCEICNNNDIHVHNEVTIFQYDPTHTTVLRNVFSKQMSKRFNELIKVIKISIVQQDCFGLNIQTNQMLPTGENAFIFGRSADKVKLFMQWLQEQVDKGLLSVGQIQQIGEGIESAWTNLYILDSYKRGIIRARNELRNAGLNVPTIEQTGGILAALGTPIHLDRLGLLYTRTYNELKGITDAMDSIISRVLTQSMVDGDGTDLIARKLVAAINGQGVGDLGLTDILGRYISPTRRADLLARTEIIRAHHQAMITEYKNWGLLGVKIKAEWRTAGDNRVCPKCADLQGQIFTLDEVFSMIPFHPLCRCIALPYIVKM